MASHTIIYLNEYETLDYKNYKYCTVHSQSVPNLYNTYSIYKKLGLDKREKSNHTTDNSKRFAHKNEYLRRNEGTIIRPSSIPIHLLPRQTHSKITTHGDPKLKQTTFVEIMVIVCFPQELLIWFYIDPMAHDGSQVKPYPPRINEPDRTTLRC